MDKLFIGLGGHPLKGDNFDFLQAAIRDCLGGSISPFSNQTLDGSGKLSGCNIVISGSNYTYGAGYAWNGNEIYYVPAQTTPQPLGPGGSAFVFDFMSVTQMVDQYEDLSSQNVHEGRYARILHNTSGVNEINSASTYEYVLAALLSTTNTWLTQASWSSIQPTLALKSIDSWHIVGGAGEPAFNTGWSAASAGSLIFKKNDTGIVTIYGSIVTAGGATPKMIFVLPVGYRPPAGTIITGCAYGSAAGSGYYPSEFYYLLVDGNNGNVVMGNHPRAESAPPVRGRVRDAVQFL